MKITTEIDSEDPEDLVALKMLANGSSAHTIVFDVALNFKKYAVEMGFVDYDDDEYVLTSVQINAIINDIIDESGYDKGLL